MYHSFLQPVHYFDPAHPSSQADMAFRALYRKIYETKKPQRLPQLILETVNTHKDWLEPIFLVTLVDSVAVTRAHKKTFPIVANSLLRLLNPRKPHIKTWFQEAVPDMDRCFHSFYFLTDHAGFDRECYNRALCVKNRIKVRLRWLSRGPKAPAP
ncbi:MAG: hypothetical protein WC612_07890 [Bdellovibrionales bacterium]|jgi:hypothetical protein